MDKATVESVMALAFELARIREQHGAQSGMYLSEVRALRAEAERLAAQAAPTVPGLDTLRADFHNWCATNGYKTGFVKGGECPMGGPVYEDHKTHAAWWAFQKATKLYAGAQSAPLAQQAREYPPLPKLPTMTVLSELQSGTQEMVRLDVAHEAMRAYVDADRAAAHVEPPAGRVIPADGEVRG